MTDDAQWYSTEADEHGFLDFDKLARKARALSEDDFVAAYPRPALRVVYRGDGVADEPASDRSGVQLLTVAVKSVGILRYLSRVAFVAKRPGAPFAHLVSIGRSNNNDITMAVESVSKVHGYLVLEEGRCRFTDHGSTNGSKLNGAPLEKNEKYTLGDGDILHLGLETALEFLTPMSLYRKLRAGS
ncbi:MAG: FHA domain-containing protein [Thermoanaerobaculia bacterium]|nr:FHA domain-containing protein [Thermoanaerobaculia bacterium]